MYEYLYYFLYKAAIKRNPDAKFAASSVVAASMIGHLLLIAAIMKQFVELPTSKFNDTYVYNKLAWFPFAILLLVVVHLYFKKHFDSIVSKYADRQILSTKSTIIVLCLIFLPFIIGITLLTK
jgi:hypothetical protein